MQTEDNLTAVLYGIRDLRLEQRPIPEPKDDEVLLKIDVVGICGSDTHFVQDGHLGPLAVDKPMGLGHEAAGTVWKVGKSVTTLKKGDRVGIEPGIGCGKCQYCRKGRGNLCIHRSIGKKAHSGECLTRYFVCSSDCCFKLPDHVTIEEGALLELLSVAIYVCKRGNVRFGSIVLIQGAGPVGLTTMLMCKAFGASQVIMTDPIQHRLDKAKEMGADFTVQVHPKNSAEDITKGILSTLGRYPTVTIDCVGIELTIAVAVKVTISGGVVVLVGLGGTPTVNIPIADIGLREIDIRGSCHYSNEYSAALEMVATGKVDVKPFITHRYKLEDTLKAFNTVITLEGNPIKVLIYPNSQ
ncbi:hypothetical protein RI129_013064 [Pyrocoelia pectoralis]|uniref:Sorbitol dehydrogenase n=1 Tax=Pyrocoelia pectoralis TaxID=417401 RepID=A0AAN7V223_9COLE